MNGKLICRKMIKRIERFVSILLFFSFFLSSCFFNSYCVEKNLIKKDFLVSNSVDAACLSGSGQQDTVQFSVRARTHAPLLILLAPIVPVSQELSAVVRVMQKDLTFTGQFDVRVQPVVQMNQVADLRALGAQGYSLVLFVSQPSTDRFEWRLYDVASASMVRGKKHEKRGAYLAGWAHNMSDIIWPVLTGQAGFFSSKIAYCKEVLAPRKKRVTHIYIADYDGSNEQRLVHAPTVTVAPRWNKDPKKPLLFYSEYTNANVRLMVADMHGRKKVASNFDGINMVPSFSNDGSQVLYCASRGDGRCHIYHLEKGMCKRITHNAGNNVSPTFGHDNNTLYFSSDFLTGAPQIFKSNLKTQQIERITQDGYCACPIYHAKRGVAYAKRVGGITQLFLYDPERNTHRQLTFDDGQKDEPSWSVCGNCLLYSCERAGKSRILLLNLLTHKQHVLTAEKDRCMYPAFSPQYNQVPVAD